MPFTSEQIDNLYAFTRKHFVEHYDLQTELVDHLANDIETIWNTQPKLSFEAARDQAFKKFGVFGFMDVVEERSKAMNKQYMKLLWHYIKDWFKSPQLSFTLLVGTVFYYMLQYNITFHILVWTFVAVGIGSLVLTIINQRKRKKILAEGKKIWMFEDIINQYSFFGYLIAQLVLNSYNLIDANALSPVAAFCSSIVFVFLALGIYCAIIVIPKNAQKHLQDIYPEYKFKKI
jgi:hypothetical protein